MKISVNPTYYCNFRCDFCYLTEEQLSDRTTLDLGDLKNRLDEISKADQITGFDVYGGEIFELPPSYQLDLIKLLKTYSSDISVITNLSRVDSPLLEDMSIQVSVSYDFAARNMHKKVFMNMMTLQRSISVLMLASPELVKTEAGFCINMLNMCNVIESVEIKPYSTNQSNQLSISYIDFENYVLDWLESPIKKSFRFVNSDLIDKSLDGTANSFSDDHVYITPAGMFAVLDFDENGDELFLEYNTFKEYQDWTLVEKSRIEKNIFCSNCAYYGTCLSEHLREVRSLDNSCNGFKRLLDICRD